MCDGGCAKKCLIFLNVLFFLGGAGLLGFGLWMKLCPMITQYLLVVNIDASDPLIEYAALVFIVVGAAAFVISLIGCCGAVRANQGLLFVYILLLLVLILGEVIGAVLALVYRGKVQSALLDSMTEQVQEDYYDGTAQYDAWNFIQTELKCCGGSNYTDYQNSVWAVNSSRVINGTKEVVPMTCCVQLEEGTSSDPKPVDFKQCQEAAAAGTAGESDFLFTEGCHDALQAWFEQHSLIMMIIGFGIGAVQLFGILCACSLRRALRDGKYVPSSQ